VGLLVANLAFAAVAAGVVVHWRAAVQAARPLDPEGTVSIRLRLRPWDEDLVERWVRRGLNAAAFVPTGNEAWGDRGGAAVRVLPPIVGDRASLVEVSAGRADAVVAGLVEALLDEGYEISRQQPRRVVLRRGPDRCVLVVAPT
jgi:hypothetical protein